MAGRSFPFPLTLPYRSSTRCSEGPYVAGLLDPRRYRSSRLSACIAFSINGAPASSRWHFT